MVSRKSLGIMLAVISIIFPEFQALAQDDFPNRPIEIILPHAPGGAADLGVRFFSEKWAEFLGQPVIVVNKPGAAGAVGAKFVAHAKPDGYTLLGSGDSPLIVARIGRKDAGYNLDSFRLLWYHSRNFMYFVVKSDSKWKTFDEFLTETRNNPGKLKYSTFGVGGANHYVAEMLSKAAGVKLTLVPFKSGPEASTALIAGDVSMSVLTGLTGLAGSPLIRVLAVADQERSPDAPDAPTLRELGYPIKYSSMYLGVSAPSRTPEKVAAKLIEAHDKVRRKYKREIEEKLPRLDQYPAYMDGITGMELLKEREKLYQEFASQIGLKIE